METNFSLRDGPSTRFANFYANLVERTRFKARRGDHKKETNGRSNKLYRGEMRPSSVIHDANLTQLDFARPSRLVGCFMVFRARV